MDLHASGQRQRSVTLNYNVTDGAASVATNATFTVTAVNDAPTVVAPLANVNVLEDAADYNHQSAASLQRCG